METTAAPPKPAEAGEAHTDAGEVVKEDGGDDELTVVERSLDGPPNQAAGVMKKFLPLALVALALPFAACGGSTEATSQPAAAKVATPARTVTAAEKAEARKAYQDLIANEKAAEKADEKA